jgi:hypothetical protein
MVTTHFLQRAITFLQCHSTFNNILNSVEDDPLLMHTIGGSPKGGHRNQKYATRTKGTAIGKDSMMKEMHKLTHTHR